MAQQSLFKLKEIKIEVTHDCILCCVHCSSRAEEISGRRMDWSSCKKILDEAAIMGVKQVAFSGGEPLLWEHITEAVNLAAQYGMNVHLYTSGNAPETEKILKKLRGLGLTKVMFSLFGSNALTHEKITDVDGSYDRSMKMISQSITIGLHTEFHFVPISNNYKSIPEIVDLARSIGVERVSILRLVPQGRGSDNGAKQLRHDQNLELRRMIKKLRRDGHDIRLGSPYNFLLLNNKPHCCSGIDRLTIGPDLRIFPCDAFKHINPIDIGVSSIYSCLKDNSLAECWEKSPYLLFVREYLKSDYAPECAECKNLEYCLSGCMAQKFYAYGKLSKCPDPMCLMRSQKSN